ncbi:MAG: ParB N-terminal domain-containing protein [Nitrospinae bacterium]|nr:ParB N-terminal domain-containing protein [Nitrospinota bacterium]
MTKENLTHLFEPVSLSDIDLDDRLTDFSLGPVADALLQSIKEIGVTHPVTLVPADPRYRIACGHRRAKISRQLGNTEILARVLDASTTEETMLGINLAENRAHRNYSAVEKGLALNKLSAVGIPEGRILEKYMPMLGLERSKKLLDDYLGAKRLTPGLQTLLHEMNVPLRTFSVLLRWDGESAAAAERLFARLRPGANKWRDLLEWIDETATRDEIAPAELLGRPEIQSALHADDLAPNVRYERIRQALYSARYPMLNDLKKRLARALDGLKLDDRTRVHIQDSFESDEIRIEMKFRTREQLVAQIEKLVRASGSEALDELIRIFRDPQNRKI